MIQEILTGTENTELRQRSEEVRTVDKSIRMLIADMEETLLSTDIGIGLAAPQIGVHKRVILITLYRDVPGREDPEEKILVMINPVIEQFSLETVVMEEGCLSLPDYYAEVERSESIVVRFLDRKGRPQKLALSGLHAREVQHEIDHLDGILFADKVLKKKEEGKQYA
ncbi:peptide deformylase [Candidatus Gracilibacteria bacterium CG17_big_fil_post_rev_8_21_14_2_50_48_13]|nr:MAG: peptide deformylase [Candidatus Gracilibacteria bacterium CG17_big_fil_post_rev_8_21_14_2_50_48_13]